MNEGAQKDLLNVEVYYRRANGNQRLLNYLIDYFIFICLLYGTGYLLTAFTPLVDEYVESRWFGFFTAFIYAVYMSLLEAFLNGKTFGKMITKTRAVKIDGDDISIVNAFARGFVRIVPFCAFSALSYPCNPWHDRWTKTMVIDEKNTLLR